MKIVSKRQANNILTDSLFKPVNGKTLNIRKFCTGKYKWYGSQKDYIGSSVQDIDTVHAVYVERRQDKNGVYAQLMCISEV